MTETLARYTTSPDTIMIELADMDLGEVTAGGQAGKVSEEWDELKVAFNSFLLAQVSNPNVDDVAAEAFDVMQALVGYLSKFGVDIETANHRHLAKIFERGNRPRRKKS